MPFSLTPTLSISRFLGALLNMLPLSSGFTPCHMDILAHLCSHLLPLDEA